MANCTTYYQKKFPLQKKKKKMSGSPNTYLYKGQFASST